MEWLEGFGNVDVGGNSLCWWNIVDSWGLGLLGLLEWNNYDVDVFELLGVSNALGCNDVCW